MIFAQVNLYGQKRRSVIADFADVVGDAGKLDLVKAGLRWSGRESLST